MASDRATDRLHILLATARKNPEFASRLLQALPEESRGQVVAELSQPIKAKGGPVLRKCKPAASPYGANRGLTAQLNAFARQVSKVG